jgi:hypothetical protein
MNAPGNETKGLLRRIARAAGAWLRRAGATTPAQPPHPPGAVPRRAAIEEFEPRLLYSADSPLSALAGTNLAGTTNEQHHLRLIDDGAQAGDGADADVTASDTNTAPDGDSGEDSGEYSGEPASGTAENPLLTTQADVALTDGDTDARARLTGLSPVLGFEHNVGQTAAEVDYVARGDGYHVYLTGGDAVIDLRGTDGGHAIRLDLLGAAPQPQATGESILAATSNYLLGGQDRWVTDVAQYGAVRYASVWDGVDVRYYGTARQLEYDFIVAAGADTGAIRLAFEGAAGLRIDEHGALVIALDDSGRSILFQAPVSHQTADDGTRIAVDSRYVLHDDGTVGFVLGDYDDTRELVIDPVLSWSTYLGGTGFDSASGVDVDASGNVYVTGRTQSSGYPDHGRRVRHELLRHRRRVHRQVQQQRCAGVFDVLRRQWRRIRVQHRCRRIRHRLRVRSDEFHEPADRQRREHRQRRRLGRLPAEAERGRQLGAVLDLLGSGWRRPAQ